MAFLYPWGNTQQLNLDWILQKIKELESGGGGGADIEEIANVLVALTYRSANTYQRYDYAFYNGKLYRAIANTTGAFNPADWLEVQLGNDVAILTRLVNALDTSLTTLQGQVADLDSDDVDNASNVTGDNVSDALDNLNGAINAENWQGKHLLIIGDSWSLGWTGSVYCENPWCDVMVAILGCTADYIRQGSGGFTHAASANASNTYPNENFVQVLDHVQNNKYDAIIVQAGWNDIHNDDATDADLGTAIYNFATKVNNYFNKTTVYLIPSYPAYLMPYARLPRAETLVRTAYYQGMVVCHYSLNWLFTNKNYRGTDVPHPNQSGYSYWGRLAAAFLRGWDGKEIKGEQSWISIAGTISGDDNIIISPTIDTTYVQSSIQLYVRMSNGTVAVYSQFRTNANFPSTSNTNVTLVTGLPIPIVQSQYLNVQFRDVQTTKREPRCSLTYDGNLVITTTGDCSDAVIILYGNYQTRSNCIM